MRRKVWVARRAVRPLPARGRGAREEGGGIEGCVHALARWRRGGRRWGRRGGGCGGGEEEAGVEEVD